MEAVGKGSPAEAIVKKFINHKFFRELATKGFFVYTMKVELSKKEKDVDGKSPKPLYDKLTADDRPVIAAALLVFNNGRLSLLLDESKRRPFAAYLLIIVFSSLITVGVYAIQNISV